MESETTTEDSPIVLGPENPKLSPPVGDDYDQLVRELSSTSIRSQRAKRRRRKRLPGQNRERWRNLNEQGYDNLRQMRVGRLMKRVKEGNTHRMVLTLTTTRTMSGRVLEPIQLFGGK